MDKWKSFYLEIGKDKMFQTSLLTCPECGKNSLIQRDKEGFNQFQSPESVLEQETREFYDEQLEMAYFGYFSLHLFCSDCDCQVYCSGSFRTEIGYRGPDMLECTFTRYNPHFFVPSLKIINLPPETPESVKEEIEFSFAYFFFDKDACMAKVRKALERFMDAEGIPTHDTDEERLSLQQRLKIYKPAKRLIKEKSLLTAIRPIGNQGVHHKVKETDVLFAYEALEKFLDFRYLESDKKLRDKAIKVNKTGEIPSQWGRKNN